MLSRPLIVKNRRAETRRYPFHCCWAGPWSGRAQKERFLWYFSAKDIYSPTGVITELLGHASPAVIDGMSLRLISCAAAIISIRKWQHFELTSRSSFPSVINTDLSPIIISWSRIGDHWSFHALMHYEIVRNRLSYFIEWAGKLLEFHFSLFSQEMRSG